MNRIIKPLILLFSFVMVLVVHGKGQVLSLSISGPTCVTAGSTYNYAASGNWTTSTYMQWCVTNGKISGTSTCVSGTPDPSISVTWNAGATSGSVTLNGPSGFIQTLNVTMPTAIVAGKISNTSQTVLSTQTPAQISCSLPTGGYCTPVYTYQWQSSANGNTWTAMTGQTSQNLAFSAPLSATTYFRRMDMETNSGTSAYTNTATITVNTPISISGATGCPVGGVSYTYSVGGTWSTGNSFEWCAYGGAISGYSGSTCATATPLPSVSVVWNSTYSGPSISLNTSGQTVSDNVIVLSANNLNITPVAQTIFVTATPAAMTSVTTIGSECPSIGFQWQQSSNETTWTNVSGATGESLSFSAPLPAGKVYYQRGITSGGITSYSDIAAINVVAVVNPGTISPSSQAINNNTTPGLLTDAGIGGGDGAYTYQWQSSPNNSTWTAIAGATATTYQPAALTTTTYYRLVVTDLGSAFYTSGVEVQVYPPLISGSVSPASQGAFNYGSTPAALSTSAATGGNGTITYQWQSYTGSNAWANTSGATATTYSPGSLSATTYYRIIATSNGASVNSNTATVTIYPQLISGSITPSGAKYQL
jgi:hypothetical protein